MKNFRTFQLAKSLYLAIKQMELRGEMRDQLERSSLSILLNLAEGSGKFGGKERKRFFNIAMGSLRETQALLEIIGEKELEKLADHIAANLYRLQRNPGPGI